MAVWLTRRRGQLGSIIFVAREITDGETRVAASAETVKKMKGFGFDVVVEAGAGAASRIPDGEFELPAPGSAVLPMPPPPTWC